MKINYTGNTKARIYRLVVRRIITYAKVTRPETTKIKRITQTRKIKIVRTIMGNTLMDKQGSEDLKGACNIDNITIEYFKKRNEIVVLKGWTKTE